jgi:hypothetical protein
MVRFFEHDDGRDDRIGIGVGIPDREFGYIGRVNVGLVTGFEGIDNPVCDFKSLTMPHA